MTDLKDRRSAQALATAERAFKAGCYDRSLQLLAEIDGYEAWSGVLAGTGSRAAVSATITKVRSAQRSAVEGN